MKRPKWFLSENETRRLRAEQTEMIDPCVYRRGDLIAIVSHDAEGYWHLGLGVYRNSREPTIGELLDARAALLHGVSTFTVEAGTIAGKVKWLPAVPCFHLKELHHAYPGTTH